MILKFLKNKNGGSTASIDYLLDKKRVKNGTSKLLSGDEHLSRTIINSLTKKQKVTFGVLSFEEENISDFQKKEIMEDFEKTFFAGLKKEQFNILWVEHTDKNRLELNFIIPKVELSTGRSFNPYFHGSDFHLADLFQKKCNLKYGFSDPKDPSKNQSLQGEYKKTNIIKDYEEVDKILHNLVADNVLKNRNEIALFLEENGIEVRRKKDGSLGKHLSIKIEKHHKSKRLKGGIYDPKFTNIEALEKLSISQETRERAWSHRDTREELFAVEKRLEKAINKRGNANSSKYKSPLKKDDIWSSNDEFIDAFLDVNIHQENEHFDKRNEAKPKNNISDNKRSEVDEFRSYSKRRDREREAVLERVRTSYPKQRSSLFEELRDSRKSLFDRAKKLKSERFRIGVQCQKHTKEFDLSSGRIGVKIDQLSGEVSERNIRFAEKSADFVKSAQQIKIKVAYKSPTRHESPIYRGMTR